MSSNMKNSVINACDLKSYSILRISGNDRSQFLQGQLTQDLGTVDALTVGFEQPEQIDEFVANVKERLAAKA